jgi:hypothetical protein
MIVLALFGDRQFRAPLVAASKVAMDPQIS